MPAASWSTRVTRGPRSKERYSTSTRYASRIETVTRVLVQMRLLLPEDAERFVEAARSRRPVTP
jgi:hypothetical protein